MTRLIVISACLALLLSFLVTLLLTPWVRKWALWRGIVDEPGGRRVNLRRTPRLGGVGVIIGFFVPLALFAALKADSMRVFIAHPNLVFGLLLGSIVVGVVGALDDMRGLGAWTKLCAQLTAACIAYAFGYRIEAVTVPLIGELNMGAASPLVTVVWFLAITNALNLIDGLDGLACGIAFFASAANLCLGLLNGASMVVMLSASLGGALLGFLRFNFYPASIFLGDAGSMFLGFVLAATSISSATTKSSTTVAILAPIIALGVPLLDTLLAMVRRTVARQSIFSADRGHIHHRLMDLGLTHRRVVLVLYASTILLAASAIGVTFNRSWQSGAALVVATVVLLTLVRAVGRRQQPHVLQVVEADPDETLAIPRRVVEKETPAIGTANAPSTPLRIVNAGPALQTEAAASPEPRWQRLLQSSLTRPSQPHAAPSGGHNRPSSAFLRNGGAALAGSGSFVGGMLSSAAAGGGAKTASTRIEIVCANCPPGAPCRCRES
jgi:UDP-GlcNAc:undecaprenyl-phosphate GlcNAc-1-phosphate transferase